MKPTNLPSTLPFLPGNSYADPTITRYHKTQLLGIKDGIITGKQPTTEINRENHLLEGGRLARGLVDYERHLLPKC